MKMGILGKFHGKKKDENELSMFERYPDKGICDVCNSPVGSGEAYLVPKEVFYASKKYRETLARNPMISAVGGSVEQQIAIMKSMDQTIHSAVCPKCIHMFLK
ncbi:unnamed protein product [marine sediment metagenome]|uniref:Uncharacterized protein n=1 Tax=marine sediment metagenome TaxID=412755 RepID=X1HFZ4_9ZZZZ